MARSLGPIVLMIDEGERAFGSEGESDGGTSSRISGRTRTPTSRPWPFYESWNGFDEDDSDNVMLTTATLNVR